MSDLIAPFERLDFSEVAEQERLRKAKQDRLDEHGEWYTPRHIFESLGVVFDLDPAASPLKRSPALKHYTRKQDGLARPWDGFVWLSPPRSGNVETSAWMNRMHRHGNGIMLWKSTTDTRAFHDYPADAYFFFRGRVKFLESSTLLPLDNSTSASALYLYGGKAIQTVVDAVVLHGQIGMLVMNTMAPSAMEFPPLIEFKNLERNNDESGAGQEVP